METERHHSPTPKWVERLRAKEQGRVSKHINGKQKPRHYRKQLRTQRKRQRQARLAQRGKR